MRINSVSGKQEFHCQILMIEQNFCDFQRQVVCFTKCNMLSSRSLYLIEANVEILWQVSLRDITILEEEEEENGIPVEQTLETSGSFSFLRV